MTSPRVYGRSVCRGPDYVCLRLDAATSGLGGTVVFLVWAEQTVLSSAK